GPGRPPAVGLAIFAGGRLACGLSTHISTLIVARCLQAIGGAAAVTGALELLPSAVGSERRAATVWAAAGAGGAALGPALGGLLTGLVWWRRIFLVQLRGGLIAGVRLRRAARGGGTGGRVEAGGGRAGGPPWPANPGSGL